MTPIRKEEGGCPHCGAKVVVKDGPPLSSEYHCSNCNHMFLKNDLQVSAVTIEDLLKVRDLMDAQPVENVKLLILREFAETYDLIDNPNFIISDNLDTEDT